MQVDIFTNDGDSLAKKRSRLLYICAAFPIALALFFLFGCDIGGDPAWYDFGTRYYTITFSGNGNTAGSAPAPIKAADNSYITLPGQGSMTKNGYTFDGWYIYSDYYNGNTKYDGGSPYKIDNSITLYAIWVAETAKPDTYIVEVTSAGIESNGSGSYAVGAPVSISAGTAPEGEVFKGWTSSSNGVVFADSSDATTTFIMPGNDVAVEAVFEALPTYNVTFNGNGATSGAAPAAETAYSGAAITLPDKGDMVKDGIGYYFDGWDVGSSGSGDYYAAGATYIVTGDVTLYARWNIVSSPMLVHVGYDGNGNKGGPYPNLDVLYDIGTEITLSGGGHLEKDGYYFDGWCTDPSCTGDAYPAGSKYTVYSGVVFYAKWVETVGTLNYGGQAYKTVMIGGTRWMGENLGIEMNDSSWCYGEKGLVKSGGSYVTLSDAQVQANCVKYGRLYTWAGAKAACQRVGGNWRLPDTADWRRLVNAAGGSDVAGKELKSTTGWNGSAYANDKFGFSALPGGFRWTDGSSHYTDGSFDYAGDFGIWWTATELSNGFAYSRDMGYGAANVGEANDAKSWGFSVRCVQDN